MDNVPLIGQTGLGFSISRETMSDIQIVKTDRNPSIHNTTSNSKEGLSLFTLLNRCSTTMGKNKLKQWFFSETSNQIENVKQRLDTIEELTNPSNHAQVNEIVSHLHGVNDITLLMPSLQKGTFKLKQWQNLTKSLKLAADLCEYVTSTMNTKCPDYIKHLFNEYNAESITMLRKLAQRIDSTIDFHNEVSIKSLVENKSSFAPIFLWSRFSASSIKCK